MTKAVDQRPDGRLQVDTLDSLSVVEAMELFRGHKIEHVVWLGRMDRGLAAFAGNFGITSQEGDGPHRSVKTLVVG